MVFNGFFVPTVNTYYGNTYYYIYYTQETLLIWIVIYVNLWYISFEKTKKFIKIIIDPAYKSVTFVDFLSEKI